MDIQDFTGDKDALLDAAFASPKLHPKKKPGIELAMRVVSDTVAKAATEKLLSDIGIDLLDQVAMYEVNNGEYADIPEDQQRARDAYESGMDDAVDAALEKWDNFLSADWLGRNTIDTQVWLSDDTDRTLVAKLAESAAKEVFKQRVADKTPVQVLSNAGIAKIDVEARLAAHHVTDTGDNDMTDTTEDLAGVAIKIKAHVGKDFNQMAVYEDIETLVEEDDDILAGSAASRLGIGQDEIDIIQLAILNMDDPASEIVEMIDTRKVKKKEAKAAEKAAEVSGAAAGGIDPSVFVVLKECGAGNTAMAEILGVSRGTYISYIKGKTYLVPDEDQYASLRGELVGRANRLLAGLAALDGTELQQVA